MSFSCGVCNAALDYAVFDSFGLVCASFYDRSFSNLKSIGASLSTDTVYAKDVRMLSTKEPYEVFYTPVTYGKEKYFHAFAMHTKVNKDFFITTKERAAEDFYNYLMNSYDFPLLERWKEELLDGALKRKMLNGRTTVVKGTYSQTVSVSGMLLEDVVVYRTMFTEERLKELITELFEEGRIWISKNQQKPLEFRTMDDYFANYGHTLVENLEKQIQPLTDLNGNTDKFVLNSMRLFPQQVAQVNGITELLKNSHYGILNMGMGTGKTICSVSMVESFFNTQYLKRNPKKELKDIYLDEKAVQYRNIVMCPGHLVKKWASEIKREVPYAKVTIIESLSQLCDIRAAGKGRNGKEWFIIGKDKAKLSYQSIPVPTKVATKRLVLRKCTCGTLDYSTKGEDFVCGDCGGKTFAKEYLPVVGEGMVCPECKEILLPNGNYRAGEDEEDGSQPLMPHHFTNPTNKNARCHYCGTALWRPHVRNLNTPGTEFYDWAARSSKWHRSTHYANKTHRGKKTVWVHSDYEDDYYSMIGESPLNQKSEEDRGCRKFAPATYIKKHLKGFFDMFILDEAHLFKGGATAQGNAMQSLVSASKYQLALTGTIAGGMATHLFYLLYRLDPARMKAYGYDFSNEMKFAEKYGTLETQYECSLDENESSYNTSSRGRQLSSPKVKPGISPLIFRDFLLDKTVFLDLSDMSKFLPALKEMVVSVDVPERIEVDGDVISNPENDMLFEYRRVIDTLKELSKKGEGRAVLSKMLQFSLSYLDHPYGVMPIKSSFTGDILCAPKDFSHLIADGKLLAKEQKLVELVKGELLENRNCVVFAEFTGSPETCVTGRLREILMKNCFLKDNEVVIIESTSPAAAKREEWMHKKAQQGAKVFIVQPRCVETGLDFCWKGTDGVLYNYPTLIFYQLGYSLFTVWQASRRAFRLNQREECRTYYMAYAGTVQQAVIQLIAEKQVATSAIQGKFSTEGLSAMAQGVDVKVKLAQAMSEMDSISGNGLQDMFDVLNQENGADENIYSDYRPMLTFKELVGEVSETKEKTKEVDFDAIFDTSVFDSFMEKLDMMSVVNEPVLEAGSGREGFHFEKQLGKEENVSQASMEAVRKDKRISRRAVAGQVDFFSMVG